MNKVTMVRGDSNELSVSLTDSQGDPFDLTGASVTMTVGSLFDKSIGDGITVADPDSGIATITIDPEDTEGAPDVRVAYRYDVQITLADGRVKTPIRGLFVVLPDQTTE